MCLRSSGRWLTIGQRQGARVRYIPGGTGAGRVESACGPDRPRSGDFGSHAQAGAAQPQEVIVRVRRFFVDACGRSHVHEHRCTNMTACCRSFRCRCAAREAWSPSASPGTRTSSSRSTPCSTGAATVCRSVAPTSSATVPARHARTIACTSGPLATRNGTRVSQIRMGLASCGNAY